MRAGKLKAGLLVSAVVVPMLLAGLMLVRQAGDAQQTARTICQALNRQNAIMVLQFERSRVNLPRIAYYQQHKRELRDQLAEVNRWVAAFAQRRCT